MKNEIFHQEPENCGTAGCWCQEGDDNAGWYWGNTTDGWNGPFASKDLAEQDMESSTS